MRTSTTIPLWATNEIRRLRQINSRKDVVKSMNLPNGEMGMAKIIRVYEGEKEIACFMYPHYLIGRDFIYVFGNIEKLNQPEAWYVFPLRHNIIGVSRGY